MSGQFDPDLSSDTLSSGQLMTVSVSGFTRQLDPDPRVGSGSGQSYPGDATLAWRQGVNLNIPEIFNKDNSYGYGNLNILFQLDVYLEILFCVF